MLQICDFCADDFGGRNWAIFEYFEFFAGSVWRLEGPSACQFLYHLSGQSEVWCWCSGAPQNVEPNSGARQNVEPTDAGPRLATPGIRAILHSLQELGLISSDG